MTKEITVTINEISHQGDGISRMPDGKALFVPFTLAGEKARVKIIAETKRFAKAELIEIIQASPERVHSPRCSHFKKCGGCQLQHLPYKSQLEIKTSSLRAHLWRTGGIENPPLAPIVPSPNQWGYRNHIQFSLTPEGLLGFHAFGTHEAIPINECHLPDETINSSWPQLDLEPIPGLISINFRSGEDEEVLLGLESSDPVPPEFEVDLPISAVHLGPDGPKVLAGREYVVIRIYDRIFRVSAGAFFQVNTIMAEKMVSYILENIPKNSEIIYDLYCGGGLFSAFLASRADQLICVETSEMACNDFIVNLDEFNNVSLYAAPVEVVLQTLGLAPNIILVDPPRSGLGKTVIDSIIRLQPGQLIYVSCNPSTLARDAKLLDNSGYLLTKITPFDLFPQTYHVESISIWQKPQKK